MNTLDWALLYIEVGWKVFPLHSIKDDGQCTCGVRDCGDAGKHPRGSRGLKEASGDENVVRGWFSASSVDEALRCNIGIVTGAASGITVIDIDTADGKGGDLSWAEIVSAHGEPDTLCAQTGSGGNHLVFKYNSSLKTASNVLGKGIDCRNDGGYIVACPSRHKSGGVYSWLGWDESELKDLPAHLAVRKDGRGRPRKDDPRRQKYSIEQVKGMLEAIPADDRDLWRSTGIILGRAFNRVDEAWQIYVEWSNKWGGQKGRNHDEIMHEAFYVLSQQSAGGTGELSMGTIVSAAMENGWAPRLGEVPVDNFIYFAPGNNFVYRPTGTMWVAEAVNAAVSPINENGKIVKPAEWLRLNQMASSMTKDPSLDGDYIKGFDYRDGEAIASEASAVYNTYYGPSIIPGDSKLASPFLAHVRRVFPLTGDADQFLNYMAHLVQKPAVKLRFALLIAGTQGVGKDTAIEMCCPSIGVWNVANVDPSALDSGFNEYAASTLIRISEAANTVDMNKWAFNERMKVLIAGAPDIVTINPKFGLKYSTKMHCGVIVTTNHLLTGIHIPEDDRRYDVIDSASKEDMEIETPDKNADYFSKLWSWFHGNDGARHIMALLLERDLTKFNPATSQRKTLAHGMVVRSNLATDHWMHDALFRLGNPDAFCSDSLILILVNMGHIMKDVGHKMQPALIRCGYFPKYNPDTKDGRWTIDGRKTAVYGKREISVDAAVKIAFESPQPF